MSDKIKRINTLLNTYQLAVQDINEQAGHNSELNYEITNTLDGIIVDLENHLSALDGIFGELLDMYDDTFMEGTTYNTWMHDEINRQMEKDE